MSLSDEIRERARRLVKRAGTRDPFKLAAMLDVEVLWRKGFKNQKGALCVVLEQAFIMISDELDEQMAQLVCAHELAHAVLHKQQAAQGALCEFDLFNMATDMEYEANEFAAEILIDTRELRDLLKSGLDVYACARALDTNVNLLLIKLAGMKLRRQLPFEPGKDFMGRIGGKTDEWE